MEHVATMTATKYVIYDKSNREFLKGRARWCKEWTNSLAKARVYDTKANASLSKNQIYKRMIEGRDPVVIPITVSFAVKETH